MVVFMPLNYHKNGIFVKIKYGSGCAVVSPKALQEKVVAELARAGMRYQAWGQELTDASPGCRNAFLNFLPRDTGGRIG